MLMETIIQIKVKPFFIEQPLSYYWKPVFTCFFKIFLQVKAAFPRSGNEYLFNESFILAGGIRVSVSIGNSILFFTASFLLVEPLLALNFVSTS